MLQWPRIYKILIIYSCVRNVKLQNFTTTTTTTEAVDFMSLDALIYCKFQPNGYDCDGKGYLRPRFYYDLKMEGCKTAYVSNCPHNLNVFNTLSECHETCRESYNKGKLNKNIYTGNFINNNNNIGIHQAPKDLSLSIICRLQYDFGNCNGYHPKWYYDISTRRCKGFSYSGCGGNMNRFATQQLCATACSGLMGT